MSGLNLCPFQHLPDDGSGRGKEAGEGFPDKRHFSLLYEVIRVASAHKWKKLSQGTAKFMHVIEPCAAESEACREEKESGRIVPCKAQRPRVDGDVILRYAKDNSWISIDADESCKRYRDLQLVRYWWNEGTFTWDGNPPGKEIKKVYLKGRKPEGKRG